MLDTLFTIGQTISALLMIYGLYLAIDYALFGNEAAKSAHARQTLEGQRSFSL
jgi:hypothetical protein